MAKPITNTSITLTYEDGWAYEIKAYEEETVVTYFEPNGSGILTKRGEEQRYTTYEDCDISIANAILQVRKSYKESNK